MHLYCLGILKDDVIFLYSLAVPRRGTLNIPKFDGGIENGKERN